MIPTQLSLEVYGPRDGGDVCSARGTSRRVEAEELIMFEIRRRRDARAGWVGDAYRGTAAVMACRGRGLQGEHPESLGQKLNSVAMPCKEAATEL